MSNRLASVWSDAIGKARVRRIIAVKYSISGANRRRSQWLEGCCNVVFPSAYAGREFGEDRKTRTAVRCQ